MSNFFEQELRKLFADGTIIRDPVFVGRACLGSLDRNRQVRAEFVTLGHADHYAALRLTLLDNNQGVVDKLILRFKDIWGKRRSLTIPTCGMVLLHIFGWMATESIGMPTIPPRRTTSSSGK